LEEEEEEEEEEEKAEEEDPTHHGKPWRKCRSTKHRPSRSSRRLCSTP
jgi:hypothetical protein